MGYHPKRRGKAFEFLALLQPFKGILVHNHKQGANIFELLVVAFKGTTLSHAWVEVHVCAKN